MARIVESRGGHISGFLDNNPTVQNENARLCRQAGYQVLPLKETWEQGHCLLLQCPTDMFIGLALEDQLKVLGGVKGSNFMSVYDGLG
jgi:hypothetical protein